MDDASLKPTQERALNLATRVFGSHEAALEHLQSPKQRYGGLSALEFAKDPTGAEKVIEDLIQLDEGYFG